VKLLIEKGVDLNARANSGGTALSFLCKRYPHEEELLKAVRLFMDEGFDMTAKYRAPNRSFFKNTPLDCLNDNYKIENKDRIAKLLLGNSSASHRRMNEAANIFHLDLLSPKFQAL